MGANANPALSRPLYGPQELSPTLPEEGFLLTFVCYAAAGANGDPSASLFAAGRVSGRYVDIYGGRLAGAVQIVAVDAETGAAYSRNGDHGKPVPLPLAMHHSPQPPPPGVARAESAEFYFAVDLMSHLNLPRRRATYTVFLWLDEMVSEPQLVEAGTEAGPADAPPWPSALTLDSADTAAPPSAPQLQNWGSLATGAAAGGFALLGLDFRSREVKALSASGGGGAHFSFRPRSVFNGPGWLDAETPPRRAFLLICGASQLSKVITVEGS
jgi:hypothetical protein